MYIEIITLIGVILTFIASLVNIWITSKQSNKNTFINTITTARKEYLVELRKVVTEFCAIAVTGNEDNTRLIELSYQLKTLMNPAEGDRWDCEAVEMIDRIVHQKDKKGDVNKFVALMQSWFALEWHGMTVESELGTINKKEKQGLRDKHYSEYQKYVKRYSSHQDSKLRSN